MNSLPTSPTPQFDSFPPIQVRPATHADLPFILEIYNEAVLNTTASYDYNPTTLEARVEWYENHLQNNLPILVAELTDGTIAGWSSLSAFRRAEGYCFTAEDSVYVAVAYRGKGIGKQLLIPLIEAAQQRGLHSIVAGIDAENEVSIGLHARLGFETVACLKEVAFKFDRWLDLVLMQRMLKP
ncbi:MAG TPA: N-acetyltransferase family protein [Allocoleopsis sp.]